MVEKFIQKFYQLSDDNEEMEADEDDDPDDIDEIFKIEGNLFDFETPLCKAFNEFNYLLKIDTDLFTFYIQGIRFYEEYELNNNTGDLEEPWSDNGVPYQLYIHEDDDVLLILGRPFLSTAHAKIDVFKRKFTLRVGEEKLVFKSIKPATSKIRRIYVLKEGTNLDSKTEFIGEAINESFDRHYGNYIKLNDLDMPREPRMDQGENFEPTLDFVNEPTYKNCYKMKFSCMMRTKDTESSKSAHDPSKCQVRRFEMIKYSFDANDELQYGVSLGLGYNVLTTYIDLAVRKSTIHAKRRTFWSLNDDIRRLLVSDSIRHIQQRRYGVDFTRKRTYSIPNTAYPTAYIRPHQELKKGGMMNDFRNEMATYRDFTTVPKFDGTLDPIACTNWISTVEGAFRTSCCKEKNKGEEWIRTCTWKEFKEMFNSEYALAEEVDKIREEFQTLTQTNETMNEIWKKFNDLIRYYPEYHGNEKLKVERFQRMLHGDIREVISPFKYTTLDDLLSRARVRKVDLLRRKKFNLEAHNQSNVIRLGEALKAGPKDRTESSELPLLDPTNPEYFPPLPT
ncbi:zinc finger, CCHC-type, retrotransposon gag domain protein [Tanacetum coccineum]